MQAFVYSVCIIIVAGLLLYQPSLPGLLNAWSSDDYSYCYLIVPLFLYLIYDTYDRLLPARGSRLPGYALLLLGGALFLAGRLGALKFLVHVSMWFTIIGTLLVFLRSAAIRPLTFPALILLFAIPFPSFVNNMLSLRLKLLSSQLAEGMLHMLAIPVFREGNIIDLGHFQLQVVDACSGLRYLFPSLLISLLLGHFTLRNNLFKVLLALAAIPVAVLSNAVRIAFTGVMSKYVSPELAEGFFHDFSGFMVYALSIGIILLLCLGLKRLDRSGPVEHASRDKPDGVATPSAKAQLPHLFIGLALIGMLAVAHGVGVHGQIIPERRQFTDFPISIGEWRGERKYLESEILAQLWADDYVTAVFHHPQGNTLNMLISYYGHQAIGHTAHAPTSCLLGGGWLLESKGPLEPDVSSGRNFPIQQMVLTMNGQRILSNFWFEQRGRTITSEYLNKWYLIVDAMTKQRSDGALIRVEMLIKPNQSLAEAQDMLDAFLVELKALLPHYVPS